METTQTFRRGGAEKNKQTTRRGEYQSNTTFNTNETNASTIFSVGCAAKLDVCTKHSRWSHPQNTTSKKDQATKTKQPRPSNASALPQQSGISSFKSTRPENKRDIENAIADYRQPQDIPGHAGSEALSSMAARQHRGKNKQLLRASIWHEPKPSSARKTNR